MTWHAHLQHTGTGLALTFAEPVSRLDMTPEVAQHLASLLAVEARQRLLGVVRTLEAKNSQLYVGDSVVHTLKTSVRENSQLYVGQSMAHPHFCDCDECLNGDDHA
jgi:hypothetical protein